MAVKLTKDDRLKWRHFLNSPPGIKGMQSLEESQPSVHRDDHSHNIILAAGEKNGHGIALSQLRELQNFEDTPESDDQFPGLEPNRTR